MPPAEPAAPLLTQAEAALRRVWGFPAFRDGQAEAIEAVLAGRDALAVLPTGGGKSLLYQVPAVVTGRLVLVVSPLVALMEDQAAALAKRRVPALALHAGRSGRAVDQAWTDAEFGKYRLLYCTPERLLSDLFLARAARLPVALLAVDEAHCISEWGHDFRPAYRRLAEARAALSVGKARPVPVLAVTATATPEVRRDIVEQLGLRDPAVVVRGFDRPNVGWHVRPTADKPRALLALAQRGEGGGLVYTGTRRAAEAAAALLQRKDMRAEAYHAGLDAATREGVQGRWLAGRTRFVCATSAFGMGVDRPDVRLVVHTALPPSVEAYYQEAGRAGRDGDRAHAVLLLGPNDAAPARARVVEGHPDAPAVQAVYGAAASMAGLAVGSEADGPAFVALDRLTRAAGVPSLSARAALAALEQTGALRVLSGPAVLVRFALGPEAARAWAAACENPAVGRFTRLLLRTLPAEAFAGWVEADLVALEKRARMDRPRLLRGLAFLELRGVLAVQAPEADGALLRVLFLGPRAERVALDAAALGRARRRSERRLEHVLRYTRTPGCRRRFLLAYFGERAPERCGRCDVCLGRTQVPVVTPADEPLLAQLLAQVARGDAPEAWLPDTPPEHRDALGDWLVLEGVLRLTDPLSGRLEPTPEGLRRLESLRPARA